MQRKVFDYLFEFNLILNCFVLIVDLFTVVYCTTVRTRTRTRNDDDVSTTS